MEEVQYSSPYWDVVYATDPAGHDHFYLRVANSVLVVAETVDECVVLVDVDRRAGEVRCTEFPGGALETGETPLEGARRELLEETALGGGVWTSLGCVLPSSAWSTERCFVFHARGVDSVEGRTPDGEVSRVRLTPPTDVYAALTHSDTDAVALAAWSMVLADGNV